MVKLEAVALELLEYRIADLRSKRPVRDGVSGTWEMYRHLLRNLAQLSAEERERLEQAGRSLRRLGETSKRLAADAATFDELVLTPADERGDAEAGAQAPLAEVDGDFEVAQEQAVLQKLAAKVWWRDIERYVRRLAGALRAERDRYTARLLYATHRNLALHARRDAFSTDANLAAFKVLEPIPERDDVLLSVNDVDSLAELVRETVQTVLTLVEPGSPFNSLGIARVASLDYVRRAARAVAEDPYAGRLSALPQRGPNSQQLRIALEELGKEALREDELAKQRQQLEARLQRALAYERHQRQLFQDDVARFVALVDTFFDRLARYLPRAVGGQAAGPRLQGGVLFAHNPALRLESVPPDGSSVTLRLMGPTRLTLAGTELAISGSGPGAKLYLQGEEHPLEPEGSYALGKRRLLAFSEGGYLHLKMVDEAPPLAKLVAEALAVFFVLASEHRDAMLALLRVVANNAVGEPQELVRLALERVQAMSASAPSRRVAIEGLLRGSARAAGVALPENAVLGLVQRFHSALTAGPADLQDLLERVEKAESSIHQLSNEPLALSLGAHNFTIRQYRGRGREPSDSLVVMMPGQSLGSFTEYLIEPLGDGTLICVRADHELAVIFAHEQRVRTEA